MRSAIIGSGLIAGIHAQALSEIGQNISVAVNPHLTEAEKFAQKWSAEKASADFSDALLPEIDCVHICTPPAFHYEQVKAALEAGKNVICEKPLCLMPEQAQELSLLAEARHLVNAVDFNVRFFPACREARNRIQSAAFGRPCLIHGSYLQEFHALPEIYSWRYKPELAGKMRAVTEIGSHWMDLACFWTGLKIECVSASFGKFAPERFVSEGIMYSTPSEKSFPIAVSSEDAAAVTLRFSNGALGSMLLSEVSHGRNNYLNLEVTGTKESLWWNSENSCCLFSGQKGRGVTERINAFSGGFPDSFRELFREVYRAIETGKTCGNPPYPTFRDGYANAAVCEAIFQSSENGSAWTNVKKFCPEQGEPGHE